MFEFIFAIVLGLVNLAVGLVGPTDALSYFNLACAGSCFAWAVIDVYDYFTAR